MRLKKIISAVCAFAMAASLVTVASAASLGGKPTIKATFDSYEKVSDTVAFAYVNLTIDMTAAETLEVYSNELDEITWDEIIKGNGISTMGSAWTVPTGFTYTKAKSTIPAGLTVDAKSLAFGPKTAAEEYWTEAVTTIKLAYRVNDFNAKGDVTLTTGGSTIDGTNSAEGNKTWSYADAAGTITLTGCSIPSYNEWSTPVSDDKYEEITSNQTVSSTNATEGKYASTDGTMKTLKHVANVLKDADATKRIRIIKTLNGVSETMETQRSISDVLGGVAVADSKVSAKVAIGVLTADADAVFSFELID